MFCSSLVVSDLSLSEDTEDDDDEDNNEESEDEKKSVSVKYFSTNPIESVMYCNTEEVLLHVKI